MPRYDAYLLRIWRGGFDEGQWAGRLEHLPDGSMQRFGSLEELLAYLGQVLAAEAEAPRGHDRRQPRGDARGHEMEVLATKQRWVHGE
ncbi:MAG: hypothetical protein JWO59_2151 [Chloroflexi bacterium]|nr:hypothetical protein [Chloroflexota bacterium]